MMFEYSCHTLIASYSHGSLHVLLFLHNLIDIKEVISALPHLSDQQILLSARKTEAPRCVSCAVVGNGGILNGSRLGKEINEHDYVFRLNGAVTKGYERDVGNRTSFYGFTASTVISSIFLKYIRNIFYPNILTYMYLRSKTLKSKYWAIYRPTTGALVLLTALHLCDTVSAYGFMTEDYKSYSNHYYDKYKKEMILYANHDFLLEKNLWRYLHQENIMKLYQRT
uniref:alpha-N-acetylgalactosaminide alpha-2,6-sialyltransferase n=1 Tax=Leptobrachium leishanense TaxID=445787 RepID=A0A8C5MSX0_9ANUR